MAGDVKHVPANNVKTGTTIVIDGVACKVTDIKVSRPGKHGHAKCNITAVGIFDEKKRNIIVPGHDHLEVPLIGKKTAQVLSVTENMANVMDEENYETFDLVIPEELKDKVSAGATILYWQVLGEKIMKQLKSEGS